MFTFVLIIYCVGFLYWDYHFPFKLMLCLGCSIGGGVLSCALFSIALDISGANMQ